MSTLRAFNLFLQPRRQADRSLQTHLSKETVHGYSGAYTIGEDDIDEFHELYIDALKSGLSLDVLEKPTVGGLSDSAKVVLIDFDIKFKTPRLVPLAEVQSFCVQWCAELLKLVSPGKKMREIKFFFLTRNETTPDEDGLYNTGFHLIAPDLHVPTYIQDLIRTAILKAPLAFQDLPEAAYDKGYSQYLPITMYGSSADNRNPYLATHYINLKVYPNKPIVASTVSVRDSLDFKYFVSKFSVRRTLESTYPPLVSAPAPAPVPAPLQHTAFIDPTQTYAYSTPQGAFLAIQKRHSKR